jgi:hypothetical protein
MALSHIFAAFSTIFLALFMAFFHILMAHLAAFHPFLMPFFVLAGTALRWGRSLAASCLGKGRRCEQEGGKQEGGGFHGGHARLLLLMAKVGKKYKA